MLHIILGILKVIVILTGILLLLVLGILAALMLVPVRYRLEAVKEPGRVCGTVRGSWLLHIVSATLTVSSSGGQSLTVKLFGIRLPLFRGGTDGGKKKKRTQEGHAPETFDTEEGNRTEHAGISDEPEGQEPAEVSAAPGEEETAGTSVGAEVQKPVEESAASGEEETAGTSAGAEGQEAGEASAAPGDEAPRTPDEPEEDGDAGNPARTTAGRKQGQHIFSKIRFSWNRFCDRIRQVLQNLTAWGARLERLFEKGRELLRKPQQLLDMAEKYEMREVFGGLLGQLLYLLLHYKPRRIRGYLKFGTGDPASTGELTGLIYLLLPARADRFAVTPDFYEKVFETELICVGHVRAIHLLRVLWRTIRDKKVRKLVHMLRKRGHQNG